VTIRELNKSEVSQLQKFFEDSKDYFLLTEKREPSKDEAENFFNELPEGKTITDKLLLGIFEGGNLVGILDFIKDYPEKRQWYIGLFLITPKVRKKGLGSNIFRAVENELKKENVGSIVLSVESDNTKGISFWQKFGFTEYKREQRSINNLTHEMIYFRKNI